eukprot:CAMPEP_0114575646 /NCGR_PEP_ID=MMETSP0125-20121206/494_1 /TAXON_ID=485358 ORGANISM="Aristerostoma sp., Strain ATCC 50986" /NCGR_SAMPLE_ID=MMETSP0125 /ASSEMBLY_ACC=CAM_ASM_000245 /LENGTH=55 /DNA_ID=CAMNT_0001763541 /DNA_START=410 /DNA_END=577 /DNA_ORIENTATION=-
MGEFQNPNPNLDKLLTVPPEEEVEEDVLFVSNFQPPDSIFLNSFPQITELTLRFD